MARKLNSFDFSAPIKVKEDHPLAKYLDGNTWKLTKEDDFPDKDVKSIRHSFHMLCNKRDFTMQSKITSDSTIVIRATPKEEF